MHDKNSGDAIHVVTTLGRLTGRWRASVDELARTASSTFVTGDQLANALAEAFVRDWIVFTAGDARTGDLFAILTDEGKSLISGRAQGHSRSSQSK